MKRWITQLRKGLAEFAVLNVVRRGESYGYQIVQDLRRLEELAITESTVYPVLSRLRRDGYLKVRVVASPDGPARRYFSLTALGRRRVQGMNAYWFDLTGTVRELIERQAQEGDGECDSTQRSTRRSRRTSARYW